MMASIHNYAWRVRSSLEGEGIHDVVDVVVMLLRVRIRLVTMMCLALKKVVCIVPDNLV